MSHVAARRHSWWFWMFFCLGLGGLVAALWFHQRSPELTASESTQTPDPPAVLAPGTTDTLIVDPGTVQAMQLKAVPVKHSETSETLRLTGQLMIDPNRLVHVHTRFTGEVVQIGLVSGPSSRPLRVGDSVKSGQLLALIWSKEVGEKKSDLVDSLSQLALHESLYKNLKSLQSSGAVPQRSIDEMQRSYESDLIQVERLRRTLRSWRIDEHELAECESEANRIHEHASLPPGVAQGFRPADPKLEARWAEIEVRAPFDGVILEKNFTVGDIVGADQDMYKIADLTQLLVMANIYEEDLPRLMKLPPDLRKWKIRLPSEPLTKPIEGHIETVGNVIDSNQHSAVVWGWIPNDHGNLRVGQFVEAKIAIPLPQDTLEIPATAVIDAGERFYVIAALNDDLTRLQRRPLRIQRRTADTVYFLSQSNPELPVNTPVLTRGIIELSGQLDELAPAAPSASGENTTHSK